MEESLKKKISLFIRFLVRNNALKAFAHEIKKQRTYPWAYFFNKWSNDTSILCIILTSFDWDASYLGHSYWLDLSRKWIQYYINYKDFLSEIK